MDWTWQVIWKQTELEPFSRACWHTKSLLAYQKPYNSLYFLKYNRYKRCGAWTPQFKCQNLYMCTYTGSECQKTLCAYDLNGLYRWSQPHRPHNNTPSIHNCLCTKQRFDPSLVHTVHYWGIVKFIMQCSFVFYSLVQGVPFNFFLGFLIPLPQIHELLSQLVVST